MSPNERLNTFLAKINDNIYAEPPAEPHLSITHKVIATLMENRDIASGQTVLDVGCGQGLALELFKQHGLHVTGITLGSDFQVCRDKGFNVQEMDMASLEFDGEDFDFIWCRHALEHSIFPLFTLSEFHRLLRSGGGLYVEVPAPDTVCHHESNPNHYSVFGKSMWFSLFEKARFQVKWIRDFDFTVPAGPDTYWGFLLQRQD